MAPYMDCNDDFQSTSLMMPPIRENLPCGDISNLTQIQTYGPCEYLSWVAENLIYTWFDFVHVTGWSYGASFVAITAATRLFLTPLDVMTQVNRKKMALITPYNNYLTAEYKKDKNKQKIAEKKNFRLKQGIYPAFGALNMFNSGIHMINFNMIFWSWRVPCELTRYLVDSGFWWFPNLMAPDPLFILPVVNAVAASANFYFGQKSDQPKWFMPYVPYLPFLAIIFTHRLPALFHLYMFFIAGWQMIVRLSIVENPFFKNTKYGQLQISEDYIRFLNKKEKLTEEERNLQKQGQMLYNLYPEKFEPKNGKNEEIEEKVKIGGNRKKMKKKRKEKSSK